MSDKDIALLIFYGAAAAGLYFYSKKKKHPSQPAFKSFLTLMLPPLGIFLTFIVVTTLIGEFVTLPRNSILSGAVAAVIVSCIIVVVRWSLARIAMPVMGYVPERPKVKEPITKENGLRKAVYMEKYRVSEKALDTAIGMKKIRAAFIEGCIYIEDRKL